MYFPYLRGKQFDLIAIRELSSLISESQLVHPVIEPVRDTTSTLRLTTEQLVEDEVPFTLIVNPEYGDYTDGFDEITDFINEQPFNGDACHIGLLLNGQTNFNALSDLYDTLDSDHSIVLIYKSRFGNLDDFQDFVEDLDIAYNLFGESVPIRRYRRIIDNQSKVILSDPFNAQRVNADYAEITDEFFTDEHNFYEEDGFVGFADYTTIGDDYSDSGFAPYAVAIHLTYKREDDQIWIKHFVSDSNEDISDPAGKYREALRKLVAFINEENIETVASNEFREHLNTGHYPGLGSVKKLSIKHHIELVNSILTE